VARQVKGEGPEADPRCVQLTLDQHGRRAAVDSAGNDTSADCWDRL
jgi:hypothetical protein